ncbi:hypothetical protein [Halodurantibacterium flavum]|uniref:Uncharacterized protein n=1 Tax=Halodurantibacterium flavum TaxID=1382802 RepID=A0ABW4S1F4_9RHOB
MIGDRIRARDGSARRRCPRPAVDPGEAFFRFERLTSWQDRVATYVGQLYRPSHRLTARY